MRKFDTKVQLIKYKVLREVARLAWSDTLYENLYAIPRTIIPGHTPTMRCCVYKERAIVEERVKLAMGGDKSNPNVIEVIDIACDDCPMGGYEVTGACRGCLAHRCESACHRDAIYFDNNHTAHIDKTKCVECGRCAKVCPYSAIINNKRPCEQSCKVKAISMSQTKAACIDNERCIACGACVYQCPWGAIMDKSFLLEAIDIIKKSRDNTAYRVYAVVAPAIASQFTYARLGQVVSGIKAIGFYAVAEAALGADKVAYAEAAELMEKGFLTSSCCPSFVDFIKKQFPDLAQHISHNLSPAAVMAQHIKEQDKTAKVIFIGPCTAKKMEFQMEAVRPFVDCVITFEELQALLDSKSIDMSTLADDDLSGASYYGRIFARSGGLSEAVAQGVKEQADTPFAVQAVVCDGIEACQQALLRLRKNKLDGNFIEGMACIGGCIGGAGCLTQGERNKREVEKYGDKSTKKTLK